MLIPDIQRERRDLYVRATTDKDGRFSIRGIPPGNYKVFAWENIELTPISIQQSCSRQKQMQQWFGSVSYRSKPSRFEAFPRTSHSRGYCSRGRKDEPETPMGCPLRGKVPNDSHIFPIFKELRAVIDRAYRSVVVRRAQNCHGLVF